MIEKKRKSILSQLKVKPNSGIYIGFGIKINACQDAVYQVSIVASVQQSPKSYAKTVHAKSTPCITHLCDVESNEEKHVRKFKNILSEQTGISKTTCTTILKELLEEQFIVQIENNASTGGRPSKQYQLNKDYIK